MKDITKHIIAKELFFFFKWMIIGGILSFIILIIWIIIMILVEVIKIDYDYFDHIELIVVTFFFGNPIIFPLIAYCHRLYKWVMKYK